MARVTGPLLSVEARGSLAGLQFSRSRAGAHCGRKSTSTRSQAPGAVAQRALIAAAQSAWAALAPAEKAAWSEYSTYPMTGQAAYIQHHLRARAILITPRSTPIPPQPRSSMMDWLWLDQDWIAGVFWVLYSWAGNGLNWNRARYWQSFHLTGTPHDRKIKNANQVPLGEGSISVSVTPRIPYTWLWLDVVDEQMAMIHHSYRFVWAKGVLIPELVYDE